ncbi:MAG TPA: DNA glycosylase [Opitutaceae bacterium]|nr:DNA glycosylase [Opitutaceae bacterium]
MVQAELSPRWTEWHPLRGAGVPGEGVLAEMLDGGQAFRWQGRGGEWTGQWGPHLARLRQGASGALEWSAPQGLLEPTRAALERYLDLGRDPRELADALPWRSDPHLARCLGAFPGLRLLRQPFGETLLCFLCSATKQIAQIKQLVARLAERLGRPLGPEAPGRHSLPGWEQIALATEPALRACGLGFRARHIHQSAQFLSRQPGWLEATAAAPYPEAKERLCELPGVGEKVADCVLLFGAGRLEAFPVDVWILRAMARRYGLEGWRPAQVAHFGRVHFGARAGLAQQYLFAWERKFGRVGRS